MNTLEMILLLTLLVNLINCDKNDLGNGNILKICNSTLTKLNNDVINIDIHCEFKLRSKRNKSDDTLKNSEDFQNNYKLEDGLFEVEVPDYYKSWNDRDKLEYCIDVGQINNNTSPVTEPGYIVLKEDEERKIIRVYTEYLSNLTKYCLIISCFFLLLVLIVYSMLPELRNIAGIIQMAYTTSLLATFTLRIIKEFFPDIMTSHVCRIIAPIMYFTDFSCFFWLNVMSFEIWKCICVLGRKSMRSLPYYCVYACGTPAMLLTAYIIIDNADLSHWPSLVKPRFETCLTSRYETVLYMHIPLFILIILNCALYIITAIKIWNVQRRINRINKEAPPDKKINFRMDIYKKLSVAMGVKWVLEFIPIFYGHSKSVVLYMSLDLYNALLGVGLFYFFICKKRIIDMLRVRYLQ